MGGVLLSIVCAATLAQVNRDNVEFSGLSMAQALSEQIGVMRKVYTSEVVTRGLKAGLEVDADFAAREGVLPLPASMVKLIGRQLEQQHPGSLVRLYSRFPFKDRPTEPLDEFESWALTQVELNPLRPAYRLEEVNGVLSMRYASADVMGPGCVACHNSHPLSPKVDWQVGDVRGALEVVVPVQASLSVASDRLSRSSMTVTLVIALGLGALIAVVIWIVRGSVMRPLGRAIGTLHESSSALASMAQEQATSSKEQATTVVEVSATVRELLVSSRQISENSANVADLAQQTTNSTQTGSVAVRNAQSALTHIRSQVDTVMQHMVGLGTKSQEIGAILNIIKELAERTNILAINATVEAMGSSESGKRFVAVADEMRNLATRVSGASKEVRTLVEDIRTAASATIAATEDGSKAVDLGEQEFRAVSIAFAAIADAVASATEATREIELGTRQQATAVEQVNVAMSSVSQGARETEVGLRHTVAASAQLSQVAKTLSTMMGKG